MKDTDALQYILGQKTLNIHSKNNQKPDIKARWWGMFQIRNVIITATKDKLCTGLTNVFLYYQLSNSTQELQGVAPVTMKKKNIYAEGKCCLMLAISMCLIGKHLEVLISNYFSNLESINSSNIDLQNFFQKSEKMP